MEKKYARLSLAIAIFSLCLAPAAFAQFQTSMHVPEILDQSTYNFTMDREQHNFNRNGSGNSELNLFMNTFSFNHTGSDSIHYLGPTMVWRHGRQQTLSITNNLDIPTTSSPGPYNAKTTVHLHGAHVPAWVDGGPHGVILPGQTRTVSFDVLDDPCALWYHPHGEDETYTQVEMGLAGMIIVKDAADPIDPLLPNTYGQDDFPIIIQDHVFDTIPSMQPKTYSGVLDTTRTQHQRTPVINGIWQPYLDVPPQNVRFRVLDGSSRLAYQYGIGTINGNVVTPLPFKLIGSDGGYLSDSARTVDSVLTGVGIRKEIVFDFSPYAGQTLYFLNLARGIPANIIGRIGSEGSTELAFIEFRVGTTTIPPLGIVPPLPHLTPYDTLMKDTTRVKQLNGRNFIPGGTPVKYNISSNQYEYDIVNDVIDSGAVEVWTIQNTSDIAHPFHVHDIQFYVTDYRQINGPSLPLPVEMLGKKDDILIQSGYQFSLVTQFNDFANPMPFVGGQLDSAVYMYHCHILTHEDGYYASGGPGGQPTAPQRAHFGMMQQFVVWNGRTIVAVDQQSLGDNLILFPNPTRDVLHLQGSSTDPSTMRITDLGGRILLEKSIHAFDGTETIDVSALPPGMVLAEWRTKGRSFTRKVVIR